MAENKKSKKKVLLYYLILAACLLVIAAITVTVVFTVGRNKNNTLSDGSQIENPGDDNPGGDNPGGDNPGGDNPGGDDKPTGTDDKFQLPVNTANVTCAYEFAFDKTLDRYAVHKGMDFKGEAGDSVYAAFGGTVTEVVTKHLLNENYVTIKHANGLSSTYKYIDAKEGLKVGDTVKKGDVIGTIALAGGMEMDEGEHLHFEMSLNGKPVDPNTYLDIIEK